MGAVAWAAVAFFFSGIAALVYQVAWQRILALHSGVGIYSIAMIVCAFMAGLGIGSHLGGVLSVRLGSRQALRAFAGLETAIAAFGAFSTTLYYDWLYLELGRLYSPAWRAALFHLLALLPPTMLMGMSLPFLVRAMVSDASTAGRTIGVLYGVNVLGAAVGALVTPWALIRFLGVRGAVLAAAACNLIAGLGALALDRLGPPAESGKPAGPDPAATAVEAPGARPFALWVALYGASGFCALSLEIVWFRIVDVAVKSTAFTFGTVLSLYLLGSAAGSLAGASRVSRIARPLRAFLICQCLLLAWSGLSVLLLVAAPPKAPFYNWFFEYWARPRPFTLAAEWDLATLVRLYGLVPLALYGVPTVLMGLSFPVLQRAVQDDPRTSGRKAGLLQAANIAGCVAGSLLVGLVSLTWLGVTGTLRALLGLGVVFALIGIRYYGARGPFAPLSAALFVLALLLPGQDRFWLRLHGHRGRPALVEEDATSVVALMVDWAERWSLWINGKSMSVLPYGGVHTWLGAVPAVVHPLPRRVAVIGLGSGDTAWAAGCRLETESLTVFEISAPQLRLLRRLAATADPPAKLNRFLGDVRLRVVTADGRNAVDQGDSLYDVIETDAFYPWNAGSGNLYSVEFFSRCARKLAPGGLMCTWSPTARVYATFCRVFPHVVDIGGGLILVGSRDPIPIDAALWSERLRHPRVLAYLGEGRAGEVLARLGSARPGVPPVPGSELNEDLDPRDEFFRP